VILVDDESGALPNKMHEHFEEVDTKLKKAAERVRALDKDEEEERKEKLRKENEEIKLRKEKKRLEEEKKRFEEEEKQKKLREEEEEKLRKEEETTVQEAQLPVNDVNPSVYDCLNCYTCRERLCGNNAWECPNCEVFFFSTITLLIAS
jgi:ubiquitin C-terminal hydrolase